MIASGALTPIVAMASSEHVIMQNEALIALAVMSSTVGGIFPVTMVIVLALTLRFLRDIKILFLIARTIYWQIMRGDEN